MTGHDKPTRRATTGWPRDMARGLLWALLIVLSILFYSGMASHFIYVDF